MARAGTGDVLQIQKLLKIVATHHKHKEAEEKKKEEAAAAAAAAAADVRTVFEVLTLIL